jgi:hypothetical protein
MLFARLGEDGAAIEQVASASAQPDDGWVIMTEASLVYNDLKETLVWASTGFERNPDGSITPLWSVVPLSAPASEAAIDLHNTNQRALRGEAFKRVVDVLAIKMLRGEPDADGTPITPEKLAALAAEIRKQFPYEAEG